MKLHPMKAEIGQDLFEMVKRFKGITLTIPNVRNEQMQTYFIGMMTEKTRLLY